MVEGPTTCCLLYGACQLLLPPCLMHAHAASEEDPVLLHPSTLLQLLRLLLLSQAVVWLHGACRLVRTSAAWCLSTCAHFCLHHVSCVKLMQPRSKDTAYISPAHCHC